jgi:hypothetical protein
LVNVVGRRRRKIHARATTCDQSAALDFDEALVTTKIHSLVGLLNNGPAFVTQRPPRSTPHADSTIVLALPALLPLRGRPSAKFAIPEKLGRVQCGSASNSGERE